MRYLLVTLDATTGTHTLHNHRPVPEAPLVALAHSLGPAGPSQYRMLIKSHDNLGDEPAPQSKRLQLV